MKYKIIKTLIIFEYESFYFVNYYIKYCTIILRKPDITAKTYNKIVILRAGFLFSLFLNSIRSPNPALELNPATKELKAIPCLRNTSTKATEVAQLGIKPIKAVISICGTI